ncbi:copper homeostasis protein CutC [Saccharopolyspora sp. TS4A08]|uniref:PF03932 family protein CutC n=1 Tax=Saccharopolyspora ipomoeae TaxID=3042027 RepID=A0ABT6PXW6_9PSEU|nr:copper homeostasis protein CutC [Saccharopolyspora sp. TS4A08]MDI2032848.1 copper homeostasis protein CutC [Saccharopolyspora sp. TS4A08]
MTLVEISTDGLDGAVLADRLGADRVELCSAGALGGLTPGPGLLDAVLRRCRRSEVHVLIRPREGGFRYSPAEVAVMRADVRHAVAAGAAGVVVGALDETGALDAAVLGDLVADAGDVPVALHRAVDVCPDPVEAANIAAGLGIRRVLSSGGAVRAEDGAEVLRRMAGAGITLTACGGVRAHNVGDVVRAAGVGEVHAAPRRPVPSPGGAVDFGPHAELDSDEARELIAAARR